MTVFQPIHGRAVPTYRVLAGGDVFVGTARHLVATVMTESAGDQYAIGVNADPIRGLPGGKVTSTTAGEAIDKSAALLAQGRHIDLGLAQISDRQLERHHLTLATAFDDLARRQRIGSVAALRRRPDRVDAGGCSPTTIPRRKPRRHDTPDILDQFPLGPQLWVFYNNAHRIALSAGSAAPGRDAKT